MLDQNDTLSSFCQSQSHRYTKIYTYTVPVSNTYVHLTNIEVMADFSRCETLVLQGNNQSGSLCSFGIVESVFKLLNLKLPNVATGLIQNWPRGTVTCFTGSFFRWAKCEWFLLLQTWHNWIHALLLWVTKCDTDIIGYIILLLQLDTYIASARYIICHGLHKNNGSGERLHWCRIALLHAKCLLCAVILITWWWGLLHEDTWPSVLGTALFCHSSRAFRSVDAESTSIRTQIVQQRNRPLYLLKRLLSLSPCLSPPLSLPKISS